MHLLDFKISAVSKMRLKAKTKFYLNSTIKYPLYFIGKSSSTEQNILHLFKKQGKEKNRVEQFLLYS
jgi:hypothetical protein